MSTKGGVSVSEEVVFGREESIKTELLAMVKRAEDPLRIISRLAHYLETASGEVGYAAHIEDNIKAVYGCAFGEKSPFADEREKAALRLTKLKAALLNPNFTDEEKERIRFAIQSHEKNIARLDDLSS